MGKRAFQKSEEKRQKMSYTPIGVVLGFNFNRNEMLQHHKDKKPRLEERRFPRRALWQMFGLP